MIFGRRTLFLVLVTSVSLSYHFYHPLPDNIAEPWKVRTFCFIYQLAQDFAYISEVVGYKSALNFTRGIEALGVSNDSIPDGMIVTNTEFQDVPVRIYRYAADGVTTSGLVFIHGGYFAFGSIDTHDGLTKELSLSLGTTVFSIGYRLAPEFPYPIPMDDCVKAVVHLIINAQKYAVDPSRIALIGDSAGGNLAAATALRLKGIKELPFQPKVQVLIYPTLQAFDFHLPSILNEDDVVVVTRFNMAHFFLAYLGEDSTLIPHLLANNHTSAKAKSSYADTFDIQLLPPEYRKANWKDGKRPTGGSDEIYQKLEKKLTDPYFAPLMANLAMLAGSPEAFILTVEHDPLRDDGILYARKLEKSGVRVTWKNYEGGYHGMMNLMIPPFHVQLAKEAFTDIMTFLQERL